MSTRPFKVLMVDAIHDAGISLLASDDSVALKIVPPDRDQVLAEIGEAHAITLRNFKLTSDLIERAGKLRVVSRHGVGYDLVDVQALTERRIPLALALGTNTVSVAEQAFALLIALTKRLLDYDAAVRHSGLASRGKFPFGELAGKQLLLIGFGRIGREFGRMAQAFGMHVEAFDPQVPPEVFESAGVVRVESLDQAIPRCHVVSLHVPLTDETRNVLDVRRIAALRDDAIVLNSSRAGLIDEPALAAALAQGRLWGVGLDTSDWALAADGDHIFNTSRRVIRTPYVASLTAESVMRTSLLTAQNTLDGLRGGLQKASLANPEVL